MSDARWSLSVEEFGPVKQASVTLAPLTLFVGQNSSGKSHMASLIWALLNAPVVLLRPELARGPAYEVAKGVVQAIQAGEKRVVTADDWSKILAWINQTIADSSEPLLTRIFGCRDCKAQAISATPTGLPDNLPVRVTTYQPKSTQKGRRLQVDGVYADGVMHFTLPDSMVESALDVDFFMLRFLAERITPRYQPALYIPAARTGLMLALEGLVDSLWGYYDQKNGNHRNWGLRRR